MNLREDGRQLPLPRGAVEQPRQCDDFDQHPIRHRYGRDRGKDRCAPALE
jgi:hypothetical protein